MLVIFLFKEPLWVIVFDHTRTVTNPFLLDNLNPLNPPNLARWSAQLSVQFQGRAAWIYHICRPWQKDLRERPFGKRVALLHWSLWLGVLVKYVSVVHSELYGSWSKYPFHKGPTRSCLVKEATVTFLFLLTELFPYCEICVQTVKTIGETFWIRTV